jgi:hypothetical protein
MKTPNAVILFTCAGLLGAGAGAAAFWLLTSPLFSAESRYGPWRSTMAVGEAAQSPYSRARVALYGIWGLPPREVIYFTADEDELGETLRAECTYEVTGGALPTRWWSLTLYRGGFYVPNPANRYSWSMSDVRTDNGGRWTVTLRPSGEGQNVLTFGAGAGRPLALLRLYQPEAEIVADRGRTPLPSLRRLRCDPAAS